MLLLNGLTEESDPTVVALESSGAGMTADLVRIKVIQDGTECSEDQEAAVWSKGEQYRPPARRGIAKNIRCSICGRNNYPNVDLQLKTVDFVMSKRRTNRLSNPAEATSETNPQKGRPHSQSSNPTPMANPPRANG